jgi:hypothetical protein
MKAKYYIYTVKKGSSESSRKYFDTYEEARKFVRNNHPPGDTKGIYHIYPVNPVYYSKSDGRKSFGAGNKEWEKSRRKK